MKCLKTKPKKIMKKVFIAMGAIAAMACSCTKEEILSEGIPEQEGQVRIVLVNEIATKATGGGHTAQVDDNYINTLDIFLFKINEGGLDDGKIDTYKRFEGSDLNKVSNIILKATTGKKMIYVIANSKRRDWSNCMTRDDFEQQMAYLSMENVKDFLMTAEAETTVELESTVSMELTRMVSRIKLNSVRVSFVGTPYEGIPLQNVKAYLTNVQARKRLGDGAGTNLKVFNSKKYVASDVAECTMQGMLYDELEESICETVHNTPHYFYCYENDINEETDTEQFTRLVIEGTLNGITYYYPVSLKELKRNSCYSVDVKISRPGSLDPEKEVGFGTLDMKLSIQGWDILPGNVVEF